MDVLSQLNFFMQENLVSTDRCTELRDHRNQGCFSDIQTHCYIIDFSGNKETRWFIRSLTIALLFCRDNYFLPSWKHLWDPKTLQEISCLLHLKACDLTEILKTRLRGKCSVAYILSFVIITALNFPAQGKFPSLLVQIARGFSLICFLIQFLIKRKSFDGRSSVCFHPGI